MDFTDYQSGYAAYRSGRELSEELVRNRDRDLANAVFGRAVAKSCYRAPDRS